MSNPPDNDSFVLEDLITRLKNKEIDVAMISSAVENDYNKEKIVSDQFLEIGIDEMINMGQDIIEFGTLIIKDYYVIEEIKEKLAELNGEAYAEQFESARLVAWRGPCSENYSLIKDIQAIFEEHKDSDLRVSELSDCRTIEEMRSKIDLLTDLAKGEFERYNTKGVDIFNLGEYQVRFHPGSWENIGGIQIHVIDDKKSIMQVGGKIHRHTDIRSIHGGEDSIDLINDFRESVGIHPANLTLLLYLKLSQYLEHEKITIFGAASGAYNFTDKNSALYMIPRNYFRLKVNPENNLYEFDGEKRDTILDKFEAKNDVVAEAFGLFESYLN